LWQETLNFSVSGKIPKGEAIYCEALAFSGKYDLDYDSTVSKVRSIPDTTRPLIYCRLSLSFKAVRPGLITKLEL